MTSGALGGNTYIVKTADEMEIIKNKIRQTKLGGNNPNARKVKCKNVETEEEYHFDSAVEMQKFFNYPNHTFINRRCTHSIQCLFNGIWAIAYEEDEYNNKMTKEKNIKRRTNIQVEDLTTGEINKFPSYASAERYYELEPRTFSHKASLKGREFVIQNKYKITILD